jgi:hypothetical protein
MLKFNEGRACDAIIRHLEVRAGVQRSNVRLHDNDPQRDRNVELTFDLGGDFYAMEHTGIEPFSDFMRMNREAYRLFEPIIIAVSAAVPPNEVFELHIPAGVLTRRKKRDLKNIQDTLVRFILDGAPKLPLRRYADWRGVEPDVPPGVPFAVKLFRFASSVDLIGRCQLRHVLAGDVELLRADRIRKVCDEKFPKLAKWKASHNARTVLILEDNDIQNTNEAIVAETFSAHRVGQG